MKVDCNVEWWIKKKLYKYFCLTLKKGGFFLATIYDHSVIKIKIAFGKYVFFNLADKLLVTKKNRHSCNFLGGWFYINTLKLTLYGCY